MNKPAIKQKPILTDHTKPAIQPKPSTNDLKKKSNNFIIDSTKLDDLNDNEKLNNSFKDLSINQNINNVNISNELKFSQKVLDKDQLNKAFQLINQTSLSEKDDTHYDIRVDEDQIETCNQIIKILLEAGYFRANINGLSEFDKIIGGMVWCIELCNIDIDIDLFYQDSLTIGQKISLTEKIVKVLHIMKCPHHLKPHQIQGLDCINILPVVLWLIKESHEHGLLIKDYIDLFACYKFNCDHDTFKKSKEDLLVISRSKEAKKLIKEYLNKNEIKINLEFKAEKYENELNDLNRLDKQLDKDNEKIENELKSKKQDIKKLEEECTKLTKRIIDYETTEKKQLAFEYSKLVDQFKQLKQTNKLKKSKMKMEYENLLNSTNFELNSDLIDQLEFEKIKLNKLKVQLAEKNKNYLVLRRKYDNILSKEEMSQYQKRFIELSVQVSNKLNETKKFFILYNQLDSTKKQLENKFLFFESLLKCYNQLNVSSNSQMNQQFILQLDQKINSLNSSLINVLQKNQKVIQRKQILEQQNVELIEMKRIYYKKVKELKEEMMK